MKKRNKKWAKEKEYRRLKTSFYKNRETQRNLGWVELDEPIFIGYTAKLEPRKDIQNREDAWIFWDICKSLSEKKFAKKIEDFDWNKKVKPKLYYDVPPRIKCIHESVYDKMPPQVKKYFVCDTYQLHRKEYKYRFGIWYVCVVPDFFWEIVYEKTYKTKVRIIDELLLQEEAELESKLYSDFYDEFNWYSSAPRHFRNSLNRLQRARSKEDIRKQINGEDPDWTPNYKNAKWLWW
jgi:hypothetical protein